MANNSKSISELLSEVAESEQLSSMGELVDCMRAHLEGALAAQDAIVGNEHYTAIVNRLAAEGRLPKAFTPLLESLRKQADVAEPFCHPASQTQNKISSPKN